MIERVTIRRFKRFNEVTFDLPGHIVLAGPNNTGKTTLLQAIAAWDLALTRWKQLNNNRDDEPYFTKAPIARQAFSAVPLRAFDLLWNERDYAGSIEIEIKSKAGWTVAMELIPDSTEQVYVLPKSDVEPNTLRNMDIHTVFVPPMTGISTEEPVYTRPKVDKLLGQGKPGDIIRNLLVEAYQNESQLETELKTSAWYKLTESIERIFNYKLLPPDWTGPDIIAEYKTRDNGPKLDIASAGSGFQQVLMLLTFLHTRPGSVLLLDEPDAHLHVILQDTIYSELRTLAAQQKSQLIIATHSEVIINSVEPHELCMMMNGPKILKSTADRSRLVKALGILTQTEMMLAQNAPGILYVEGRTDINLLLEWAKILDHPAYATLTNLFWRPTVRGLRRGASGVKDDDHYKALQLVRKDMRGLILLDRDGNPRVPETSVTGAGLQKIRWRRYEIESYLVHPTALERFIERKVKPAGFTEAKENMLAYLEHIFKGQNFLQDPLPIEPNPLVELYLQQRKARTEVIPPILQAAGLEGIPYTEFNEIASVMKPSEIHPEVKEKLDAIQRAFGLPVPK